MWDVFGRLYFILQPSAFGAFMKLLHLSSLCNKSCVLNDVVYYVIQGQISFLKILSTIVLVSALSLVTISTTGQLRLPHLRNGRMYLKDLELPKASDTESIHQQSVNSEKV